GETGLDGADLAEPVTPLQDEHAVNYLVRAIMDAPEGELTVCTLGPMTNLAMAMTMEPRIVPRLREVVLMGGVDRHPLHERQVRTTYGYRPHA
ncbi:nucleoside hydrolase, partial [Mesorhizobium sp. M2E.F.Ca.ET.209.01.1.1]|uniref:nucleoside hydrolase n=1 Tax=Mesorhizobium sp. M2E.F.Ca.ET.209.01.1.1 TaxID=2500526 RepID=UPI001FEF6099